MRRVTAMEAAAGRERKGLREAARADTLTRLSLKLARRPSTAPTRSLNSRGTGGGWMSVVQAVHGGRAKAKAVSMLREIRVMASTRCLQTHTEIVLCARSGSIPSPSLSLSRSFLWFCVRHTREAQKLENQKSESDVNRRFKFSCWLGTGFYWGCHAPFSTL